MIETIFPSAISLPSIRTVPVQTESVMVTPAAPLLDPIDLSKFSVISTDTDAGKADNDPKSKMSMKDFIAHMLLLIEKLNSLKEEGPQPLNARIENKDEMAAILDQMS